MSQPRQVFKTTNIRVPLVLTQLRHATYGGHMTEAAMEYHGEIPPWTQGWRLQRSLSWAGMTTEDMADELGVARSTVSRWCNDKGRPTKGYLKLWALRTGVPLAWLMVDGLPRVDSNHQPAGWLTDNESLGTAEVKSMAKPIVDDEFRRRIRYGSQDHNPITNIGNAS
jgi:transcriptional regulator with XRE-family HTH domain